MGSDDLIDFEIIENQKENIQSLPSGRSAKALAQLYTPPLSSAAGQTPSPSQTQDAHNETRRQFEKELLAVDESDDPLDIYDRYVKWTLDAYPSAQNTPQSQLCQLLERATKGFQSSTHYKDDPRYLKLWLHYIRFFSDAPREAFAYLARHDIGDKLALFYEEFAAWLETAGRWTQAEEVYSMGIDREARPVERLVRKYGEFQHRFESRSQEVPEPTSPALPTVRPALAAKVDPFSTTTVSPPGPQAQSRARTGGSSQKSSKPKLAIFADGDEPPKPGSSGSTRGWDSIGSIGDRKKENTTEARPWAGETLKVGKKNTGLQKMMIFKDENESNSNDEPSIPHPLRAHQQALNTKTGRLEIVHVDLQKVYPNRVDPMSEEYSFEELRARHRGWLGMDWAAIRREEQEIVEPPVEVPSAEPAKPRSSPLAPMEQQIESPKPQTVALKGSIEDENDENMPPTQGAAEKIKAAKKARREERSNRTRKIKVMDVKEIRGETQTIQTNLDSPTGRKVRRKKGSNATVTINTREAMNEIYDIFSQPLHEHTEAATEAESEDDSSDDDDDDYTSAGESTGTGRISCANSEFGDDTTAADFTLGTTIGDNEDSGSEVDHTEADNTDAKSVSAWSEFTKSKHIPEEHRRHASDDEEDDSEAETFSEISHGQAEAEEQSQELATPTSPEGPSSLPTRYVPVLPEDYNVPTRPYRDPAVAANSRLPFMTPIVEKTESSLGFATAHNQKEYFAAKTPSRSKGAPAILEDDNEPWSSPFQEVFNGSVEGSGKVARLALREVKPVSEHKPAVSSMQDTGPKDTKPKGPIIQDTQCNPVDEAIRETILREIQPPLSSYDFYFADNEKSYGKGAEIRRFTKIATKANSRNSSEKTATNLSLAPTLKFQGSERMYTVKKELGKGAFAPVYLAESISTEEQDEHQPAQMGKGEFGLKRHSLEAIKMEEPPSPWEFYIMRQAKRRLGVSRPVDSVIHAYEMHMFRDECYLIEEFRDQGTLLDLVNVARAENGVMDEQLAMFFTIELFRTVEALHSKGLIHGDLKSDNILVRFDALAKDGAWESQYKRDGTAGWASKGIALIDFGRGIDMKAFTPNVQFIADWPTTEADCAEMRELRPWTYQIDYHGLAGIIHNLLFGRYISTIAERAATLGAGATKTYRLKESLKRYWQTEIWQETFDLLLNPLLHLAGEEGKKMPISKGMRECRERMEEFLEGNCEKGLGLKSLIRRMEDAVKKR